MDVFFLAVDTIDFSLQRATKCLLMSLRFLFAGLSVRRKSDRAPKPLIKFFKTIFPFTDGPWTENGSEEDGTTTQPLETLYTRYNVQYEIFPSYICRRINRTNVLDDSIVPRGIFRPNTRLLKRYFFWK